MYPERREDTREEEENFYIFKNIFEFYFCYLGKCAAISQRGVLHHHAILGPYNTILLLACLDGLIVFQLDQREPAQLH